MDRYLTSSGWATMFFTYNNITWTASLVRVRPFLLSRFCRQVRNAAAPGAAGVGGADVAGAAAGAAAVAVAVEGCAEDEDEDGPKLAEAALLDTATCTVRPSSFRPYEASVCPSSKIFPRKIRRSVSGAASRFRASFLRKCCAEALSLMDNSITSPVVRLARSLTLFSPCGSGSSLSAFSISARMSSLLTCTGAGSAVVLPLIDMRTSSAVCMS
mmetsp:Transcript_18164/g.35685  ORF Transcript_18164/g.35685 Transcript_18164/m.35685 type:complete len:214 (-) Transcript_18164:776-1417(-)